MVIAVLLLILLLITFIMLYLASNKKNKNYEKQFDDIKEETTIWENKYKDENQLYTNLTEKLREQQVQKQDVTRRRRVTQTMKNNVLLRDNKTCQICGISYDFLENLCQGLGDYLLLEVDHIQSVANGGNGKQEDNLQCLCWRCNRTKGKNKTNDDVKSSINYGINKLIPRISEKDDFMLE